MKDKLSEARKILEDGYVGAKYLDVYLDGYSPNYMARASGGPLYIQVSHRRATEAARAAVAAWKAAMAELGRNPKARKK